MQKRVFEEAALGRLRVKNRLVRSATWLALSTTDGLMFDLLFDVYRGIAEGGAGTVVTGFTSVASDDHAFGGIARLSEDRHIAQHARLAEVVHAGGAACLVQLALGECNRDGVRDIAIDDLDADDLARVREQFVAAAIRAAAAGYDGVQIHVAHGFFLSRMASPAFNHRADAYGGGAEGRSRLVCEIIGDIRAKAPRLHVGAKVNGSDLMAAGLTPEEGLEQARCYVEAGLESIEVSANGTSVAGARAGRGEAYFEPFGRLFAQSLDIPVILVGGHRSLESCEAVLERSGVDFLSLSRPLIREPGLPHRWESGDTAPSACISCNSCYHTPGHICRFNMADIY